MSSPYYLITAPEKALAKVAKHARKLVKLRDGDPVLAVGAMRIVLAPLAVDRIKADNVAADGTVFDVDFSAVMCNRWGATSAVPISEAALVELLVSRSPEELNVERALPDSKVLMRDGFDWHLKASRLVEAWALVAQGWDPSLAPEIDWEDVRVGQIDTGFRPIPALGFDKQGHSPWVLTDLDRNYFFKDFEELPFIYGGGRTPSSECSALDPLHGQSFDGHGTRTGSVLAGFDLSAEACDGGARGYFGAAPKVPYVPVRIADSVIINHVQVPLAKAIDHLVNSGCGVITMSMGIAAAPIASVLREAINRAYEEGVILVCAAGNIWKPVVAPARLNRTLAVAGCTHEGTPWSGSSSGPEVDIAAPAWPIRRASVDRRGRQIYGVGDGTSFAAPQVAAAAAMWWLLRGAEIRGKYPMRWQWVEAFRKLLQSTAQPGVGWNRRMYGPGLLDAKGLLDAPLPIVVGDDRQKPA